MQNVLPNGIELRHKDAVRKAQPGAASTRVLGTYSELIMMRHDVHLMILVVKQAPPSAILHGPAEPSVCAIAPGPVTQACGL